MFQFWGETCIKHETIHSQKDHVDLIHINTLKSPVPLRKKLRALSLSLSHGPHNTHIMYKCAFPELIPYQTIIAYINGQYVIHVHKANECGKS